jgi:hypothetical protein
LASSCGWSENLGPRAVGALNDLFAASALDRDPEAKQR